MSTEFEFSYEEWSKEYAARVKTHRDRLFAALGAGGVVVEHAPHKDIAWKLGDNVFIEPYKSDAAHIADHLSARHHGFAWDHTVYGDGFNHGKRFHLGEIAIE